MKLNAPEIHAVSQRFKFVTPASNPPAILLIDNATPKTIASENVEQLCLSVSYTCNKCSTFFQQYKGVSTLCLKKIQTSDLVN